MIEYVWNKFLRMVHNNTSLELYKVYNYRIREVHTNWVFIHRSDWAPGVWAGTEGTFITIQNKQYRIRDVDLYRAALKLSPIPSSVTVSDTILQEHKVWG